MFPDSIIISAKEHLMISELKSKIFNIMDQDYETINVAFSEAAKLTNTPYVWGGSWKSFKDGPHFELMREK